MNSDEFRRHGHHLIDWMADYMEHVRRYPVKSQVEPGEILGNIPADPPVDGEPFERIFEDFRQTVLPGITHWQHPSFFAYFPANSSPPSVLAEMLMATLGAQCMSWQTSPAATELEEGVMRWLRSMIGLPPGFKGVIQDTASTATLCSLLTAREMRTEFQTNRQGMSGSGRFVVYCSSETHSSIEKAAKIAGLGSDNLRKVAVDDGFAMIPDALAEAVKEDREKGLTPLCAVATIGTTGSTAVDPLKDIGRICSDNDLWLHVDAAYAGSALLLPEMRWMIEGIEQADSFVFNPHKWMFTNFDCSAYFVRDEAALVRTFEILPEYLKTKEADRVKNFRDWGIQLGRRFRALKLWFVIRSYGTNGLSELIRKHISMAQDLARRIGETDGFELLAPTPLSVVCFRFKPRGLSNVAEINAFNERLLEAVNSTGKLYITHTKLRGIYSLRFVVAQTQVTPEDVEQGWREIESTARKLESEL